eukprot:COSAG02_NODE_1610_length_11681_cov_11.455103_6_plen_137_part_00
MFKGCADCLPDGDPCHHVVKRLDLAVECAPPPGRSVATAAHSVRKLPAFNLSSWTVRYPWSEADFGFASSDLMLTKVYNLCANTLRVTSLDTTTDSNTRERLPCETAPLLRQCRSGDAHLNLSHRCFGRTCVLIVR